MATYLEKLLYVKDIEKSFYDNSVLKGVSFSVPNGTIAALCGENGAGKSTLMNIINGSLKQDKGEVFFKERPVYFHKPADAIAAGIAFIPQEILFVPEFTIAEVIFLGRTVNKNKIIDYKEMNRAAARFLAMLGLTELSPTRKMDSLRLGEIQLIEIAKAISQEADLFIMDEPTTALTSKETDRLFSVINMIKAQNKSVIFISHRMNEIFLIADSILVLRDGKLVLNDGISSVTESRVTSAMLGSELEANFQFFSQASSGTDTVDSIEPKMRSQKILELNNISNSKLKDVHLSLDCGEIIGIFGLMGSGRTTLLETIFGAIKFTKGDIKVKNLAMKKTKPSLMINLGVGYITEDRKGSGLILEESVLYNTILSAMNINVSKYVRLFLAKNKIIKKDVTEILEKLFLRPLILEKAAIEYSGGNQQKIILGKWLLNKGEVLLLDEPTKGIDVIAKSQVYKFIKDYVKLGKSVIFVSSELPEVMLLADRILVMKSGRIVAEQKKKDVYDPTRLMVTAS